MHSHPIALDLVRLDAVPIAPRASTLHVGAGTRPELRNSPWWVYLAGRSLPASLVSGSRHLAFRGSTAGGHEYGGDVTIVERVDDARGTRLVLAGVGPIEGVPGR
jgi:hypothetical protein